MIFKLFKHKPVKVIVKNKKKKILESSFKSLGIADIDDSIIKTVDNDEFYMFDFTYLEPNGVDDETDRRNHFLMRQLLNSLEGKIKFYFIDETKCNLNKNIEFLPFWSNGIKHFEIQGVNNEKIEFCQKL